MGGARAPGPQSSCAGGRHHRPGRDRRGASGIQRELGAARSCPSTSWTPSCPMQPTWSRGARSGVGRLARRGDLGDRAGAARSDRAPTARIKLVARREPRASAADSTRSCRSRSALGLKYVELARGTTGCRSARRERSSPSARPARGRSSSTRCWTPSTRARAPARAARSDGLGGGLAGRGAGPEHRASARSRRCWPTSSRWRPTCQIQRTRARPSGAGAGRHHRRAAHRVRRRRRSYSPTSTPPSARSPTSPAPRSRKRSRRRPRRWPTATSEFPRQRPFLRNARRALPRARAGARRASLLRAAPGRRRRRGPARASQDLAAGAAAGARFRRARGVLRGAGRADRRSPAGADCAHAAPDAQLPDARPDHAATTSRSGSATSRACCPRATRNGTWQRFIIIAAPTGPNSEGGPSSRPADGPGRRQPPPLQPVSQHGGAGPATGVRGGQRAVPRGPTTIGNVGRAPVCDHGGQAVRRARRSLRGAGRRDRRSCALALVVWLAFRRAPGAARAASSCGRVQRRRRDRRALAGADRGRGGGEGHEGRAPRRRVGRPPS